MARTTIPSELVAINAIHGTLIADNAITAVHIATNAVSGTLIADNAVTSTHIAQNHVTGTQIAQNTITVTHIADSAVETAKINNDAVTQAKIADDAVGPDQLAANAVVSASIANGTIVAADLADDAVTIAKMAALARGKIIYGDSAGNPAALALGSSGQVLTTDGTDISWGSGFNADAAQVFNESGAAVDFRIEGDTEQNLFFVDGSADHIGIGTSSPSAALDVVTDDNVWVGEFTQSNTSNGDGVIVTVGSTASADYALSIRSDAGNTHVLAAKADGKVGIGTASPSYPLSVELDASATWLSRFYNTGTTESDNGLLVRTGSEHDGTITLGAYSGSSYKFVILGDGNVGIGTTSPDVKLEIAETASDTGVQLKLNGNRSSNGNVGDIVFENNGDSVAMIRTERVGGNNDAAELSFWTQTTGGSNSERMVIDTTGNVGIGTTSPGAKLEVSGKDDAGAGDLLRLQFDNSPADTGITMTDINSTIKNRITMDAADTADLRISAGTQMHFYGGTSNGTGAGHLTVKSSGVINTPSQARMVKTLASGQTISTSNSATINWDTNETTTDITYSSGEFTIVTAGVYLINTYARFQTASTGHNQFLSLHHKASGGSYVEIAYDYVLSCRGYHQMNINRAKVCAAGDVMRVIAWQSSGGNLDLTGNSSSCAISVTKIT